MKKEYKRSLSSSYAALPSGTPLYYREDLHLFPEGIDVHEIDVTGVELGFWDLDLGLFDILVTE